MAVEWERLAKDKGHESPKRMLEKLYIEDNYTMADIAILMGCSAWAVGNALDRFGIERHPHGGIRRAKSKPSLAIIETVLQKLAKEVK